MKELLTIRETLKELGAYQDLKDQGQLDGMMWDWRTQLSEAAAAAAGKARRGAPDKGDAVAVAQLMEQAARSAREITQAQIIEEIQHLFGAKTTE